MAYQPQYDSTGVYGGVIDGAGRSIPKDTGNRHYRKFLEWLQGQGQTETERLAANPHVPPTPSQDKIADETEKSNIRDYADLDAYELQDETGRMALYWLLQREKRRVGPA